MFTKNGTKRTREAERIASQAWDNLVSKVDTAADGARSVRRRAAHLAGDAQDRLGTTADEARWRANAALDALSGHRPPRPWGAFAAAAAIGAVLTYITTALARRAMAEAQSHLTIPADLSNSSKPGVTTRPTPSTTR